MLFNMGKKSACSHDEGTKSLKELRKLTEGLPTFKSIVKDVRDDYVQMDIKNGTSFGLNLKWLENKVAVGDWFGSRGSHFPGHAHPEREWIIVYTGVIELRFKDDTKKLLGVGDYMFLEPDTWHSAYFPEDCWYLAITIPAAEDWPK